MRWRAAWTAGLIGFVSFCLQANAVQVVQNKLPNFVTRFISIECNYIIGIDCTSTHQCPREKSFVHYWISGTFIQNTTNQLYSETALCRNWRCFTPVFCTGNPGAPIIRFIGKKREANEAISRRIFATSWRASVKESAWIKVNYWIHANCRKISNIFKVDLQKDLGLIAIDFERPVYLDGFNGYPRPLTSPHYFELVANMMVSTFQRPPLEKRSYCQPRGCDSQYASPPNQRTGEFDDRVFAYVFGFGGAVLLTGGFFPLGVLSLARSTGPIGAVGGFFPPPCFCLLSFLSTKD